MKRSILVLLIFLLASCDIQQRYSPQTIPVTGEYKQESTGFTFPNKLNKFKRVKVTKYDKAATNVGVGYNHSTMPIAITLYSYPAQKVTSFGSPKEVIEVAKRHLFDNSYERSKQDVLYGHKNSKLITESEYILEQGDVENIGIHATFTYSEQFAGNQQTVTSHLYLFQIKDMLLKYRITYPEHTNAEVEISEFINSFAKLYLTSAVSSQPPMTFISS
ncbi:hypothetical protein [Spartinivicinus ruber]|uniref:hypothetical protein n=1 Tax=Spartinivicinus ruber TaxID=2683272 RepID=UPI0013D80E29|nr:hypothetical protein [Spartinivicinus ruber]